MSTEFQERATRELRPRQLDMRVARVADKVTLISPARVSRWRPACYCCEAEVSALENA